LFWANLNLNEIANHCSGDRALDPGVSGRGILPSLTCLYKICEQPINQATHKPNSFFVRGAFKF
jgi:hypothetical protein